jgi:hypothetical protein
MTERKSRKQSKPMSCLTPASNSRASLSEVAAFHDAGVSISERQEAIRLRIPKHTSGKTEWYGTPINARMRSLDRLLRLFKFNIIDLAMIETTIEAERKRWEIEMERRAGYKRGYR